MILCSRGRFGRRKNARTERRSPKARRDSLRRIEANP